MSKPLPITERTQADGVINQPAISELSENMKFVVPSEDRDFSRPREPFFAHSLPADTAMVDDISDENVKQVQLAMKNNPISPPYPGPIDGKISRKLLDVLLNFSWTLKRKTNKSFNIVQGNSINYSEFSNALKTLKQHLSGKEIKEQEEKPKEDLVLAFQKFFNNSHPIIGTLYNGPQDGVLNDDLINAAQKAEGFISISLNNANVKGMIWGGKSFSTTPDDVASALDLLSKKSKTASFNRKKILSYLINKY